MLLRKEVQFAQEEHSALGLRLKTDVADRLAAALDEGVGDAAPGHLPLQGTWLIPNGEHVVDLGLGDDAGVVGIPDAMGEGDEGGQLVRADDADVNAGGGIGDGRGGKLVARPFQRVLPGGEVVGGGKVAEVFKDLIEAGLDDVFLADLFGIAGEVVFGEEGFCEIPAGPGAPGAQVFMRLDHAGGQVLPVTAGIADELAGRALVSDPGQGQVGQWPGAQGGLVSGEGEGEGAVALEDGLGGQAALPEALGVAEAGEVEVRAARCFRKGIHFGRGVRAVDGREMRARGIHGEEVVSSFKFEESRQEKIEAFMLSLESGSLWSAPMKILHSADWHLGARLVERERLPEQAAFLDWLIAVLKAEQVDALLVSGDVFDAANPPQEAVALYFDFLKRLADLKTVKAVITGGNHDSASHLNAPRELLRRFEVHVFGHAGENVVDLGGAVVAAVPFLRERDLRQAGTGETMATVQDQVKGAIRAHYAAQLAACLEVAGGRPVIAMGHLTVLGAVTSDSEREVHIGSLGHVGADIFEGFDYTALGHMHRPQKVAGLDKVRYSGSPIALSFSEAGDAKSVVVVDTDAMNLQLLPVPVSRPLIRAEATRTTLAADLQGVPAGSWAEITVKMEAPEPDLDRQVREAAGGRFEVLKVLADLPITEAAPWQATAPALNDLQPREVFRELLKERNIEGEELGEVFEELLALREARLTT